MRPLALLLATVTLAAAEPVQFSGIYPHLAMFNNEGECGTGAVVPWAGKLWVITYGPHLPFGSSDKLYEIDDAFTQTIRPESQGGTPANRMIHRESNQLFIGPYAVDDHGGVRVIPWKMMPGRLTASARHLADPARKLFYATMEEGLYEVDVKTLEVTGLIKDGNKPKPGQTAEAHPAAIDSQLPGYHGKGLYSGQGRVIYANNGEHGAAALVDPTIPSGALGEWRHPGDDWQLVRRNQFTEVTGPGGIFGNEHPDTDPVWSIGWDFRSLILMLLDGGKWTAFRLPKASCSYDGAHGWNTEWPRIRDIGEPDLLMTMHGMFWKFPKTFSAENTAGIAPLSSYLKIVGDFARWNDRLVLGCDDTAKSEFLNKRKVKGALAGPGQSQSNLWFVKPEQLAHFGPAAATGAVWINDPVKAGEPSEPFLFSGFARRGVHLAHDADSAVKFTFETNDGRGAWKKLREATVPAHGYLWIAFSTEDTGAWLRLRADHDAKVTADFHFSNADDRGEAAPTFAGIAASGAKDYSGGILLTRGDNKRTLDFGASVVRSGDLAEEAHYELTAAAKLILAKDDPKAFDVLKHNAAVPRGVISIDAASVLVIDDHGHRWRLPKGDAAFEQEGVLPLRVAREVCTERDLFNACGTFYELPAENAGGFIKMRPVTTHGRRITDYCSYRGLLVLTGISPDAKSEHIVRSDDGKAALWLGAVDDLWNFGKPHGEGGPWKDTAVQAGQPSDAYLMTNFDRKSVTISHDAMEPVTFTIEVDFLGNGSFHDNAKLTAKPGEKLQYEFPLGYSAKWVRLVADHAARVSAIFRYK